MCRKTKKTLKDFCIFPSKTSQKTNWLQIFLSYLSSYQINPICLQKFFVWKSWGVEFLFIFVVVYFSNSIPGVVLLTQLHMVFAYKSLADTQPIGLALKIGLINSCLIYCSLLGRVGAFRPIYVLSVYWMCLLLFLRRSEPHCLDFATEQLKSFVSGILSSHIPWIIYFTVTVAPAGDI